MIIKQFDIWLANLNPPGGTAPGKIRPVLVLQTNSLNRVGHPSTIILPLTTIIFKEAELLRINLLPDTENGLEKESAILIDQIRAIDNKKFINKIGQVSSSYHQSIKNATSIILGL
jgi:mRNA interferase MazF